MATNREEKDEKTVEEVAAVLEGSRKLRNSFGDRGVALKFFAEARLRSAVVLTGWVLPLRGRVQEVSTGFRIAYGHVWVAVTIAHGPPETGQCGLHGVRASQYFPYVTESNAM